MSSLNAAAARHRRLNAGFGIDHHNEKITFQSLSEAGIWQRSIKFF
jgi:hypothetical protein